MSRDTLASSTGLSGAAMALARQRRAAVSVLFATMAIPITMCIGLAIDFSFYIQAQSQLTLAADAGAIHAVRVAASNLVSGQTAAQAAANGAVAGQQWFEAQLGPLSTGIYTPGSVVVNVPPPTNGTTTFNSTVSYKTKIPTHFGNLFNAMLSWPLGGTSTATITTNSFVRIDMLVDTSSSMLIGTQPSDIEAIQNLTICPPTATAVATGHGGLDGGDLNAYNEYSWIFPADQGFGKDNKGQQKKIPKKLNAAGSCNGLYTGNAGECIYPAQLTGSVISGGTYLPPGIAQPVNDEGYCPTGTGVPDTVSNPPIIDKLTGQLRNLPQAPCGFACHSEKTPNDYYQQVLYARSKGAVISLRFDVVKAAMQQVVNGMIAAAQGSGVPNQFSLGVFTFNSAIQQVHPQGNGGAFVEADSQLAQGYTDVSNISVPAVPDLANTDFPDAMAYLNNNVQPAGDGTTPTGPRKNLFIVTDGLEDYPPSGSRFVGQMTNPLNETVCQPLKDKGYTIYVLYTPYYPLPNPFYLNNGARVAVEQPVNSPTSVSAALQACASNPAYYYQASSASDISGALNKMLQSALNSPGRLTH